MNDSHVQATPKLWSRTFIFVLLANAFVFLAFEMLAPTLPLYVASLGGEATQIGLVTGIFVVSAIIIRPFTGILATKMDKKYLLLIGIAIGTIATGGYYVVDHIWALVLMRIFHGFGFGVMTTYFTTIAAEVIPKERRGEGIGYFGAGETMMVSLGPLAGVMMLEVWDFKGLFMSSMAFMLLTFIIIIFTKRGQIATEAEQMEATATEVKLTLIEKRVLFQAILIALVGIAMGGVMSFIALFAAERSFEQVGLFFTIVALAGLFVRLFSGKMYDRYGAYTVLIPFGIVGIIGLFTLVMAQTEWQFLLAAFLYGAGIGAIFPALQTWCLELVEEHEHESAVASFFNFFDMGIGVGAIALGVVAQTFDNYTSVFYVAIIAYVIYLALTIIYAMKRAA